MKPSSGFDSESDSVSRPPTLEFSSSCSPIPNNSSLIITSSRRWNGSSESIDGGGSELISSCAAPITSALFPGAFPPLSDETLRPANSADTDSVSI
ncbi:hypothetical protein BLOT_002034 [Blomia tropicalis]|nr:hypothetical protein BLOT_002034 [Blomia tropicalis]